MKNQFVSISDPVAEWSWIQCQWEKIYRVASSRHMERNATTGEVKTLKNLLKRWNKACCKDGNKSYSKSEVVVKLCGSASWKQCIAFKELLKPAFWWAFLPGWIKSIVQSIDVIVTLAWTKSRLSRRDCDFNKKYFVRTSLPNRYVDHLPLPIGRVLLMIVIFNG